jgi:S-adenosylmethionine synthetase
MISVETFKGRSVTEHGVEIVERKGSGHPDHICDSIMDAISVALCREYRRELSTILHHNIDKGLLAAGSTLKRFGGGRVLKPMELIIGDRATFRVGERKIPVNDIAVSTAKRWFQKNLRFLDPEKHVRYRSVLAKGSEELTDIFLRPGESRLSNDTSAAVGYYPLSQTERIVLELERFINSKEFKNSYPETGEDTKVMALRKKRRFDITVAMPLLSRYISSEKEYFMHKKLIHQEMMRFLAGRENPNPIDMVVHYNTLDVEDRGLGGVYLSLLGTSAEDADSGQVGRGNRVNGLISVNRPMGTLRRQQAKTL